MPLLATAHNTAELFFGVTTPLLTHFDVSQLADCSSSRAGNASIIDEKYAGWWENVLYALSAEHDVYVKDVDGIFWAEVDFIEDYERIMDYVWSKKGLTKGIEQLTMNMMREGCSLDLIARVTGLSEEKLRMLQ